MLAKGPFTQEQAKEVLQDTLRENATGVFCADVFCPLTRDTCNKDCTCYQVPYLTGTGKFHYVRGACCGNAMFTNECCAS